MGRRSKRKATLSADLDLEGLPRPTPGVPNNPAPACQGPTGPDDGGSEEGDYSSHDDFQDYNPEPSDSVPGSIQPRPPRRTRAQGSHSRSRPRSERKKVQHLPHHHRLLNECLNLNKSPLSPS